MARFGALFSAMWPFCISALRSGFRSRAVVLILLLGTLLVGVAVLAGSFSPRQPQTVTMDVGFSGIRFSLVLFAVFWVQELVGREVERRTVLYALAYPVSRGAYLLGRFLGVLGLLVVAAVALGGLLWLSVIFSAGEYTQGFPVQTGWPYWLTIAGLWADAAVVAAFTLWIASLSTVQMLPVALGALFAVAGKSLGAVLDYLERGADGDQELIGRYGSLLETIQYLLPDLSRLDWRTWPMYGVPVSDAAVFYGLLMGAGYVLLLLAMAVITFGRREFF
ncbi:MAG: ABC-type transport system involved in multi-copper enzyme maturation, permease component [Candidatus Accumulibacter sp. BA-94]|nr:MAG: ABC-type transport system involved in multi-copper enzyme maturation, permease component [Candidatus Accumulibacter sp. BA-94]